LGIFLFCQTPSLGLSLGVDFGLPLTQQQQEEQEQPHQKSTRKMLTTDMKFGS